jgi:streptogramin lyase
MPHLFAPIGRRLLIALGLCLMASAGAATAASDTITEFKLPAGSRPTNIVAGADGNLWFAVDGSTPAIGRITPSGVITEYSTGLESGSSPREIVRRPDGNIWFTDDGTTPTLGRITPSGVITEFTSQLPQPTEPVSLADGPDGNLWFIDEGNTSRVPAIGRITPSGTVTEFSNGLTDESGGFNADGGPAPERPASARSRRQERSPSTPPGSAARLSGRLVNGPDGNLWFVEDTNGFGGTSAIGRITPTGTISEFRSGLRSSSVPDAIAAGPDGNLYFSDLSSAVGQVTPAGAITEFTSGLNANSGPVDIVAGPDKNMWFTDSGFGSSPTPAIGRLALSGSVPPPVGTGGPPS